MKPFVSIACITYNHERYISQAVEGFLMQKTQFPVEIIIHDDASTDDTVSILKYYKKKVAGLQLILQTENQYSKGIKPSTTYVLPKCRGKYIALCEGDDYWTDPYKLQKQVDILEQYPEFSICFTNSSIVDENGYEVKPSRLEVDRKRNLSQADILSGRVPPTNTVMMRNVIGGAFRQIPNIVNGDIVICALTAEHGDAVYLDEKTACYRIHEKGLWSCQPLEYQLKNFLKTYLVLLGLFRHKYEGILLSELSGGYSKLLDCVSEAKK